MNTAQNLRLVTEFTNPIRNYKEIDAEIKRLEKIKESYRKQILELMDENKSDSYSFDEYKAERKLVVQSRFDTSLAKEKLSADLYASLHKETSFVKLTVI